MKKVLLMLIKELGLIRKELHDIKLIMEFSNHIPKGYLNDDTYDEKFSKAHSGVFEAGKIAQR